jgi:hypothetical protein
MITEKKQSFVEEFILALMTCAIAAGAGLLQAQSAAKDPGPRGGPAGAGSYYSTLDANEQRF